MSNDLRVFEAGRSHGLTGTKFYPPSWWGKDGAPNMSLKLYLPAEDKRYRDGYTAGRQEYREVMGHYPAGGCDLWDTV